MTLSEMIAMAQRGVRLPLLPVSNGLCKCTECSKRRLFVLLLERTAERPH
jgi:hypothetical protein